MNDSRILEMPQPRKHDDANPQWYWYETPLTAEFDVLIHFESTSPTTVLPFRYPDSW